MENIDYENIRSMAGKAAYRDGYEQELYLDECGEPSFCRKGTLNLSGCKVFGEIRITYKDGVQHVDFVETESQKN